MTNNPYLIYLQQKEAKMKISIGDKLVMIRKSLGLNMTETAEKLDVVKSNLSRYERNIVSPTIYFIEKLILILHVNINWLTGGVGEMFLSEEEIEQLQIAQEMSMEEAKALINSVKCIDMPQYHYSSFGVPVYTDNDNDSMFELLPVVGEISAGEPIAIVNNEPLDFVPFPYYRPNLRLDDFFVFRVNGLSMKPEIEHQDIVFIQKTTEWEKVNNRIVAVIISGELTIKKLELKPELNEIHLIPINKNFDVLKVPMDEVRQVSLLGELKAIRRVKK